MRVAASGERKCRVEHRARRRDRRRTDAGRLASAAACIIAFNSFLLRVEDSESLQTG